MKNMIDQILALNVYNHITKLGEKFEPSQQTSSDNMLYSYYEYKGLKVWQDFDGYNCFIAFNKVTLTLMFHGKYSIESPDNEALDLFNQKLLLIANE
jgi:hypothetical protein